RKGWSACRFTASKVGIIEKAVKKIARLTSTWLGGVSGIPKAWRIIERTTTIRTNEVMQMSKAGISDIRPRTSAIRTTWLVSAVPAAAAAAAAGAAACAADAAQQEAAAKRMRARRFMASSSRVAGSGGPAARRRRG